MEMILNEMEEIVAKEMVDKAAMKNIIKKIEFLENSHIDFCFEEKHGQLLNTVFEELKKDSVSIEENGEEILLMIQISNVIEDLSENKNAKRICGPIFIPSFLKISVELPPNFLSLRRSLVETLCSLVTQSPMNQKLFISLEKECEDLFTRVLQSAGDFSLQATITEILYRVTRREKSLLEKFVRHSEQRALMKSIHSKVKPDLVEEIRGFVIFMNESQGIFQSVYSFLLLSAKIDNHSALCENEKWINFSTERQGDNHLSFLSWYQKDSESQGPKMVDIEYKEISHVQRCSDSKIKIVLKPNNLINISWLELELAKEDVESFRLKILPKILIEMKGVNLRDNKKQCKVSIGILATDQDDNPVAAFKMKSEVMQQKEKEDKIQMNSLTEIQHANIVMPAYKPISGHTTQVDKVVLASLGKHSAERDEPRSCKDDRTVDAINSEGKKKVENDMKENNPITVTLSYPKNLAEITKGGFREQAQEAPPIIEKGISHIHESEPYELPDIVDNKTLKTSEKFRTRKSAKEKKEERSRNEPSKCTEKQLVVRQMQRGTKKVTSHKLHSREDPIESDSEEAVTGTLNSSRKERFTGRKNKKLSDSRVVKNSSKPQAETLKKNYSNTTSEVREPVFEGKSSGGFMGNNKEKGPKRKSSFGNIIDNEENKKLEDVKQVEKDMRKEGEVTEAQEKPQKKFLKKTKNCVAPKSPQIVDDSISKGSSAGIVSKSPIIQSQSPASGDNDSENLDGAKILPGGFQSIEMLVDMMKALQKKTKVQVKTKARMILEGAEKQIEFILREAEETAEKESEDNSKTVKAKFKTLLRSLTDKSNNLANRYATLQQEVEKHLLEYKRMLDLTMTVKSEVQDMIKYDRAAAEKRFKEIEESNKLILSHAEERLRNLQKQMESVKEIQGAVAQAVKDVLGSN